MMGLLHLDTHTCTTMDEVIAWFTAHAEAGTPPDLVFMDMQLADPGRVCALRVCVCVCCVCVCVCA